MAYTNRGYAYFDQGKYIEAIEDFKKALKLNPKNKAARANKMSAEQKLLQTAEKDMEDTGGIDSYNKGVIFAEINEFKKAIKYFTIALEENPEFAKAYHNRAVAYFMLGEFEKAWNDVRKVKELGGQIHPGLLEEYNKANKEKL
ncbi:Photosystem I assembly protein Ycf3 [subsurface metagenome]